VDLLRLLGSVPSHGKSSRRGAARLCMDVQHDPDALTNELRTPKREVREVKRLDGCACPLRAPPVPAARPSALQGSRQQVLPAVREHPGSRPRPQGGPDVDGRTNDALGPHPTVDLSRTAAVVASRCVRQIAYTRGCARKTDRGPTTFTLAARVLPGQRQKVQANQQGSARTRVMSFGTGAHSRRSGARRRSRLRGRRGLPMG